MANEQEVLEALKQVEDPDLHRDIVALGFVQDLKIDNSSVSLRIVLTTPACPVKNELKAQAEEIIRGLPGVTDVEVNMDAEVRSNQPGGGSARPVEGVRNIIAIASNKGGVGKTTVSVNLAVALAKQGARVGLLDADVTGPNVPIMMGFEAGFMAEGDRGLTTVEKYGVRLVSLGFVLPRLSPVAWRGPMVGTAVRQLVHDIKWGELDYLFIDLPPGTSDASMSMAQEAPISGVVIVSTPADVAWEDAGKAVAMFDKLNVPVFGVIENMSYFVCPHCDERTEIFGYGGGRKAAEELGLEFLGEIPLDRDTREGADKGVPITESEPESPQAQAFLHVAKQVAARCSTLQFATAGVE
ncbi:MAG: Mrp/NBP35 family ATP-binding protein [Chloroflexi bacterium]|nr:Mrp/NBP35 family ATP-binding protein [Chloroflexota bacterium]